jgi:hypothetical protein
VTIDPNFGVARSTIEYKINVHSKFCTIEWYYYHYFKSGRKTLRPSAIPPRSYTVNGKILFFPKIQKQEGRGLWLMLMGNFGTLNGADEKHEVQFPYRKKPWLDC